MFGLHWLLKVSNGRFQGKKVCCEIFQNQKSKKIFMECKNNDGSIINSILNVNDLI